MPSTKEAHSGRLLPVLPLSALSLFTAGLWQASADEGLSAVSYAPCTVSHVLDGAAVRLSVKTNYPFGDSVLISLNAARPVEFPLYLRIPFWAENPMIHLPNGEIMSVRAGETAGRVRVFWNGEELGSAALRFTESA